MASTAGHSTRAGVPADPGTVTSLQILCDGPRRPGGLRGCSRSIGRHEGHAPRRHAARAPRRRHRRRRRRGDRARASRAPRSRSSRTARCATSRAPLIADEPLEIITERSGQDALDLIRHDAAHVLATAVLELYPGREDLDRAADRERLLLRLRVPRRASRSPTPTSSASRRKMREHIEADEPFVREDVPVARGARALPRRGPGLQGRADRGPRRATSGVETVSPLHERPVHRPLPRPARAEHRSASARSSCSRSPAPTGAATPSRQMLTRVYGTAFFKQGRARGAPRAARAGAGARPPQARPRARAVHVLATSRPGSPFWLPKGTALFNALVALNRADAARARLRRGQDAAALRRRTLWETSGHWGKYQDNIFVTEYEDREFGAQADELPRPLRTCSGCSAGPTATCPYRCAEPGLLHRREPSGTLHGLLRVRHFIQDDAHIFCTEDQIQDEVARLPGLRASTSTACSASRCTLELSTRPDEPPRQRRAVGPRRGRRSPRRSRPTASSTRSTRARARSTRRRSTCT